MNNSLLSNDCTSVITESSQLVRRRREYFDAEAITEKGILQAKPPFSPQQELEDAPTLEELNMAINKMNINISAGPDGISPKVYMFGGEEISRKLHKLIRKC